MLFSLDGEKRQEKREGVHKMEKQFSLSSIRYVHLRLMADALARSHGHSENKAECGHISSLLKVWQAGWPAAATSPGACQKCRLSLAPPRTLHVRGRPVSPEHGRVLDNTRAALRAALASRQVCAVGVEGSAAGSFFHVLYFSSCFDAFLLLYEKKRKLHTNMWVHALSCSLLDSSFMLTTKPTWLSSKLPSQASSVKGSLRVETPIKSSVSEATFLAEFSYLTADTCPDNLLTSVPWVTVWAADRLSQLL